VHQAGCRYRCATDVERHFQSGNIDLVLSEQLDAEPLPTLPLNNIYYNWTSFKMI